MKSFVDSVKAFFNSVLRFLGLKRNSKYVDKYIRDANVRSAIFMASVIVILELWLIFRQTNKYLVPGWKDVSNHFEFVFSYTSNFFLFLFIGIAVLVFSINHSKKALGNKRVLIANLSTSGVPLLYSFFIFLESKLAFKKWDSFSNQIANILLIALYVLSFFLALVIILSTIYRYIKGKELASLTNITMILFAAMCVIFGVKVSYNDYISSNPKEIICFLTMIIYGACLLIWKPYISILVNVVIFFIFYRLILIGNLDSINSLFLKMTGIDPSTMIFDNLKPDPTKIGAETFTLADWNQYLVLFKDGDLVNYITFAISLTMVSVSIYHQRLRDATKDEELEHLANYDDLTELYNFSRFVRLVYDDNDSFDDENRKIILFINITNFKTFNDQRGFEKGNIFLKEVAKLMKEEFENDPVCRQSDDHFLVYTDNVGFLDKLKELNQNIKNLDKEISPEIKTGGYLIKKNEDPRRASDKARYACSTIGSDLTRHYIEYDQKMHNEYHLLQYVIRNIDRAINEGWIKPFYQPVVWSDDSTLCGVEALARWDDPVRGLLPPSSFINTLETTKLIHKLDFCIVEQVCRDLRNAIDNKLPYVSVSLNFSRADFEVLNVADKLDEIMNKYNISKDLVHVEITESALGDSENTIAIQLNELKMRGYRLWLDDFGSGYSSLNVLKDFDFDVLKIDMKFLSTFSTNKKARPLIESVINMAEKMGMKTLCEGVETKEQEEFLKEANCGRLQGYLFGKPFPRDVLLEKINKGEFIVSKQLS